MENRETILIGSSGGPDSIFLIDYLMSKDNYNIIVSHINYNLRKSSLRDQLILEEFCNKNSLKLFIKNIKSKPIGNTQNWARKIRIEEFIRICKLENISNIFLGHQKDDFIESIIFQKENRSNVLEYGISNKTQISRGIFINRPLLNIYKNTIINQLNKKNINYGIDETNILNKYTRNKIRNNISNLTQQEKNIFINRYKNINKSNKIKFENICKYINYKNNNFSINIFNSLTNDDKVFFILYLSRKSLNIKQVSNIILFINSKKVNSIFNINNLYFLKEYKKISIFRLFEGENLFQKYKIPFSDQINYENNIIKISNNKMRNSYKIKSPIKWSYISNENSLITKKYRRFFINNKLPIGIRKNWPIFFDNNGNIIENNSQKKYIYIKRK